MAYLALSVEDVIINKWPLVEGALDIGRASDNDIQINDAAVSSKHARLITELDPFIEGQLITYLEDLASTNGTELNGIKVTREKLNPDDIITIGFNEFQLIDNQSNKLDETAIIIG
ncbi:FHA domain-containing protein [Colwellia psychrerythraea]|uniref:FHA domain containing protein n=1 Tax=Colwellia psychrerythraea TaxID=28229 RepID=A0A099L326_COLPS|nr:FHA domain-containing protein [Colwellia psychrerythraea]KGJ96268.1 FHA domain containing protein [Colwellia psychrerythraea]